MNKNVWKCLYKNDDENEYRSIEINYRDVDLMIRISDDLKNEYIDMFLEHDEIKDLIMFLEKNKNIL